MRRTALMGAVLALFTLAGAVFSTVDAGEKDKKGGGKGEVIETKASKGDAVRSTNFAKALDLDVENLQTLGSRIESARSKANPVALASLANELEAAEQASGKKASFTSAQLAKEAIELAKMRFNPDEIKIVAKLTGEQGKQLMAVAKRAEQHLADARSAREKGEAARGIQGTLHVDSRVQGISIDVFVDGRYVGTVPPYGDRWFFIGQTPWETTYLSARSYDGRRWNRAVGAAVGDFTWQLFP